MSRLPSRNPSNLALVVFSTTAMPLAALTTAMGIYLPRHLAAHVGLSLAVVGSVFGLVRLLGIFIDLFLGLAMDRTTTILGRYRVWMLIGAPVIMLGVYVLFVHTPSSTLTLVAWLLALYGSESILALSSSAWAANLVSDYDNRSRLFGLMGAVGVLGSLTMFLAPVFLSSIDGKGVSTVGMMGWIIIAAVPATVGVVAATIPERIRPKFGSLPLTLRDYWAVVSRPTFLRILTADFCFAMGPGWLSATVLFLLIDALGFSISQANLLLAAAISSGFLGSHLSGRLAVRWSKHRAVVVNAIGYAIALGGLVLGPRGNMLPAVAAMCVLGFFSVGFGVLLRAMTADAADELRLEQGKEQVSLFFAIVTITSKAAGALSIFFTFLLLARVGYDAKAGAANTAGALQGLEMVSLIGPAGFVTLGALCFWGYRLTSERHAEILCELERREASVLPSPATTPRHQTKICVNPTAAP